MPMKGEFLFIFSVLLSLSIKGQSVNEEEYPKTNQTIGLGVGLEYGGIGARVVLFTSNHVDLFGGVGYNLDGVGFNGGLSYRFKPGEKIVPYFSGMYGYNAVIVVDGLEEYNKTYYGPSIGFGVEIHKKKKKKNYFNLELVVPFRSSDFRNDWDLLKSDPRIDVTSEAWPLMISVGYHFGL